MAAPQLTVPCTNHLIQIHPQIKVELISPEYETADDTIASMLLAKQADIVEVRDITVHNYVSRGLIQSLEPYIAVWPEYKLMTYNAKLMARDLNETAYYIPNGLYRAQLYYRKDLFEAKALQVPETWEQLYFVGKQLTKPEMNQYGFAFRGGTGASALFTEMMQDYSGNYVNQHESMFRMDGTTIFSNAAAKKAVEVYRSIYTDISPPESIDWGYNEQVKAFAEGRAAMLIQDSDAIERLEKDWKEGTWATAPLPTGPDNIAHYNVGAAGWGIAEGAAHPREAWELIAFLSSVDNNNAFTKASGVISVYNNVKKEESYKTGPYVPYILMDDNPSRYTAVKPPTHYANISDYLKMTTEYGKMYLKGEQSAEMLLDQVDSFWLEQHR